MRVFLCQSYMGKKLSNATPLVFPIGLASIASMIKEDHEVHCWDPNVDESQKPLEKLPSMLEKIKPDVVGLSLRNADSSISVVHKWYYPTFKSTVKTIKATSPTCKLIVGGPGFSLFAKEVMARNPEIDFGVAYEGEHSFAQLLKEMEHPERVHNLVFKKNGKLVFTPRTFEEFESLPKPSRELFDVQKYNKHPYALSVETQRGCGFKCIFCPNNYISGCIFRLRSPKKVADEVEELVNEYGVNSLFFVASVFNYPLRHANEIIKELIARKVEIDWAADVHPAFINQRFLVDAAKSGGKSFNLSPDGASDEALIMLKKNLSVNQIKTSISYFKTLENVKVGYNFMIDLPSNNASHVAGLVNLIPRLLAELKEKIAYIGFTKMRIYPHTELYDLAVKEGKIDPTGDILYPKYYSSMHRFSMENLLTNAVGTSTFSFITVLQQNSSVANSYLKTKEFKSKLAKT